MSLEYAELSSVYSEVAGTYTSSSTILGPGALSGRAIKKLGMVVINGLDSIIYRRRLTQIEKIMKDETGSNSSVDIQSIYDDLLELSRPTYSFSIRTRAFRLIMEKIGSVEIEELASSVVNRPLSEAYQHLVDVFACLWDSRSDNTSVRDDRTQQQLAAFRAAGLSAYTGLGRSTSEALRAVLSTSFIIYISLLAALGDVHFSRMLVELNIVGFLSDLGLNAYSKQDQAVVCRLLIHILQEKFDPVSDSAAGISVSTLPASLLPPMNIGLDHAPSKASTSVLSSALSWVNDIESPPDLLRAVHEMISSAKPTRVSSERQADKQSEIKLLLLGSGKAGKIRLLNQFILAQSSGQIDRTEYVEFLVRDVLRALFIGHTSEHGALWGRHIRPESYQHCRVWLEGISTKSEISDVLADLIQFVCENVMELSYMRRDHRLFCRLIGLDLPRKVPGTN